jgi:hypothetical protein
MYYIYVLYICITYMYYKYVLYICIGEESLTFTHARACIHIYVLDFRKSRTLAEPQQVLQPTKPILT